MSDITIKPCGHHVVVRPVEVKKETESGIIVVIEDSQMDKLESAGRMVGVVLAVGSQAWVAHSVALETEYDPWASVGDTVLYSRHAGKFVFDPMSGEELYLIHDEDVLAVLPPQAEWKVDVLTK